MRISNFFTFPLNVYRNACHDGLSADKTRYKKNPESFILSGLSVGAPGRGRIHNLLIRSQTLYPVELRAHVLYEVWLQQRVTF